MSILKITNSLNIWKQNIACAWDADPDIARIPLYVHIKCSCNHDLTSCVSQEPAHRI